MHNAEGRRKIAPHAMSRDVVYTQATRMRIRMGRSAPRNGLLRRIDGPRTDVADIATYEYRLADASDCNTSPATCAWRKGDLWKTINALGHATEIVAYDGAGRALESKDANGVITQFTYHPRGWLASRTVKGATTGEDAITTFTYTPTGEVSRISPPDGDFLDYEYDDAHRLVAIEDAAGNRSSQTDARGVTATYSHDALNRLTAIAYPDSALNVAYHYDEANAITGCATSFPKGRLTRMIDASGTTAYCHDRRGNVVQKRITTGGITRTLGHAYTPGDRVSAITYPDATKISYGRNALGQITAISQAGRPDTPIVTSATYRPFGPIAQIGFAGGASQSFTYDNNHWPTAIAGTALDLDYVHDARGNIESITDAVQTRNYAYDALSRLTQVQDSSLSLETFTYDATGNRLSKQIGATTQTYAYPPDSHRLTGIDTGTRGYDAMGNLTAQGNRTFAYGDDQRLKQFQISSQTEATYTHNGKGERARKVTNTHSVQFIYDEQGRLLAEYRAGTQFLPQLHRLYVWLDDRPVAVQPKAGSYTNTWLHVHTDHLGTPRAITLPKQGNPAIWRWSLQDSAFGEHAPEQDPDGDGDPFTFNLRYPGQYFDAESGLHYNYFRDYESNTGRYAQPDPSGLSDGPSIYAYAGSSPLKFTDPTGLFKFGPSCNEQQRAMISKAMVDVMVELTMKCASSSSGGGSGCQEKKCIGCKYYWKILEYFTSTVSFQCGGTTRCAQTMVNGHTALNPSLTLVPKPSCGCLKSTIFHEAIHNMSSEYSLENDPDDERTKAAERSCFSCGGAGAGL